MWRWPPGLDRALAHTVEGRAHVGARVRQVVSVIAEVAHHLVHALTPIVEVIIRRAKVAAVGEQAVVHVVLNGLAFDFEGLRGQVDELTSMRATRPSRRHPIEVARRAMLRVTTPIEPVSSADPETIAALEELAQVNGAAASGGSCAGPGRIDEVLEVGQAVLRGHVEEGVDVLTTQSKSGVMSRDGNVKTRPSASPPS